MCSELEKCQQETLLRCLLFGLGVAIVSQFIYNKEMEVAADDIKLVTLENVLSDGQYNDLGIQVRDKLLLLMEAQSTFSENLALRMLFYVAETYKRYVDDHNLDLYSANLADEITKRLVASFGLSSDEAKAKTSEYLPLN